MHDADKLMSRCVYMNILTATIEMAKEEENSSEILDKYAANTMDYDDCLECQTSTHQHNTSSITPHRNQRQSSYHQLQLINLSS